jgi:hypothetical protein
MQAAVVTQLRFYFVLFTFGVLNGWINSQTNLIKT